jgi:protocatechuate 3,4-dioxygenase beta subunit
LLTLPPDANSTGVYSGVAVGGNGVGASDKNNVYRATNRGLQQTDPEGVAQFTTNFPGWYSGRAPHIHVIVHSNAQVTSDEHYSGGTDNHVGQLFFDQNLIADSAKVAPYSNNKQALTTNEADMIFRQEAAQGDPVVKYSWLGADLADGLFGWVAFGVDTTASKSPLPAASLAATVKVTNAGQQATGVPKL